MPAFAGSGVGPLCVGVVGVEFSIDFNSFIVESSSLKLSSTFVEVGVGFSNMLSTLVVVASSMTLSLSPFLTSSFFKFSFYLAA